MLNKFIRFFLEHKLAAYLLLLLFIGWGLATAPFDFDIPHLPRDPVAVDAIPDIGENQQIVFTKWTGRSPQDIEDQITYPLTTALLGIPGVKSVRSNSMFGFSSIYLIFHDEVEFYWSRSRILEKLNSLPGNTLPDGVQPTLGPDATALGQIFWYTLEGRDKNGAATGGWDLQELRSIQDFQVRYGLASAEGVAEVASIGGYVKEYQVDVDPEAMKVYGIRLEQVMEAIKGSNIDVGAQTIEINLAEYFVRGLGYIKKVEDLEQSVVKVNNNVPIKISDIARVNLAPATRRGVLDKSGAEAVGGVVVARYGANPLEVIKNVKAKIATLAPGLPTKTLQDGTTSQVSIIPFYDRTQLINETVGTLQEALTLEILITIMVVILLLFNLKSSLLVSGTLPVAVLMCFIAMKYFGVDANIVALSGIAIAIGTMVDMGIVLTESIVRRIKTAPPDESLQTSIYEATTEVASAMITAVATTIVSFLPVFTMQAAEGKLFKPLAYTKTFALVASILVAISIIPPLAHTLFSFRSTSKTGSYLLNSLAVIVGLYIAIHLQPFAGAALAIVGLAGLLHTLFQQFNRGKNIRLLTWLTNLTYALMVTWLLANIWTPLGPNKSQILNFIFVVLLAGGLISFFYLIIHFYEKILRFLLRFKLLFLALIGFVVYQGFAIFKNMGEEFMPALDEGSFLLMPTSMPHSGMQENIKNLRLLDMAVTAIPEVESVVGKAGRVNSALDPAPMSMYENVILYQSEYRTDEQGHRIRFKYENGEFVLDEQGDLIPDKAGRYYRQWRDHIRSPDDIWNEIVKATKLPGVTSAPKLQPIETRLVMLQTGMRAPMGIKVQGSDLATIEAFGLELEQHLKQVSGVKEAAVFADRIVGKPYLLLDIDRSAIGRYGLSIQKVQQHIQAAVGGMTMSTTVEGRERYAIRVRYPRELRNDPDALKSIYIPVNDNQQIPLGELVSIRYEQGAQAIKSEDGFLIGYVLFDRIKDFAEVEVVNNAQAYLNEQIQNGNLTVPDGISYHFAGNYEQQVRANKRLRIVLPVALLIIFMILYFQFRSVSISAMVFTGVFVAFAGGFIMMGLYANPSFLNFEFLGTNMRDLFQVRPFNLSVAVWVGFLALFGIATDDGVLVATFLQASFKNSKPDSVDTIRDAVVEGGLRRVRPAMMTTATTLLALLPILTATGRGADIMLPMAIPSFGGMSLQIVTMFTVPVLYSLWQEWRLKIHRHFNNNSKNMKSITFLLLFCAGTQLVNAQSLETLIQTAVNDNLELKVLDEEYRAALERVTQVDYLPDPEIGLGVFPLPVETRLGAQLTRISANQMLPWFGTRDAKKKLALAKAQPLYQRIDANTLELIFNIKQAYYEIYQIQKSKTIIQNNIDLLKTRERLALTKVESGKGSTVDVLKVQLKIDALQQQLSVLDIAERKPQTRINQILNRPLDTPVKVDTDFAFAEMLYDQNSLAELIKNQHPVLKLYELQQEAARKNIELNAINSKPTFGLGLDYILVNKRNDASPERNGRDILQLRASVRLPLYKEQYKAKTREENMRIAAVEHKKEETLSQFIAHIDQAFTDHQIARSQLDFYAQQKVTTQAAIQILESSYSTNAKGFDDLLLLEQELLDYDLKSLEAIVQSHIARSKVDRFIL